MLPAQYRWLEAAGLCRVYAGVYRHNAIPWVAGCSWLLSPISLTSNAIRRASISRRSNGRRSAIRLRKVPRRLATSSSCNAPRAVGMSASMSGQDSPNKNSASAFHVLGGNQIERLPPNAALERVMLDYAKLRDQARACAYRFRQSVPDKTGILNFANGRARWRW